MQRAWSDSMGAGVLPSRDPVYPALCVNVAVLPLRRFERACAIRLPLAGSKRAYLRKGRGVRVVLVKGFGWVCFVSTAGASGLSATSVFPNSQIQVLAGYVYCRRGVCGARCNMSRSAAVPEAATTQTHSKCQKYPPPPSSPSGSSGAMSAAGAFPGVAGVAGAGSSSAGFPGQDCICPPWPRPIPNCLKPILVHGHLLVHICRRTSQYFIRCFPRPRLITHPRNRRVRRRFLWLGSSPPVHRGPGNHTSRRRLTCFRLCCRL